MRALHLALALAAARAALQRAPCQHFIILKYAHTGSTWFVDELNGIDRFHVIEEFLMERFKESGELPTSSEDIKAHFVEALTRECERCEGDTRVIGLSQNPAHHTLTRPPIGPFDWSFLAELQRRKPFHVILWYRSNVVSRAIGLINEYRPGMEFCHRLKDPNSTQWKRIEEAGHHLRDCRKSKFAVAKERFLRSITWGLCEIAMYHRLADYVSDNKTHVMTYEDFVRDEDGGLKGLLAKLYPDRPGGRVEILLKRKPSDIVKRSNSQVKKMVTNAAEVEGWFAEWGGPAPLWRMFHDDGTTSFSPKDGTGQAACDHFLDICERQMGLSTCLKLEKFTMGTSN